MKRNLSSLSNTNQNPLLTDMLFTNNENRPIHNLSTMDDDGIITPQSNGSPVSPQPPPPSAINTSMISETAENDGTRRNNNSLNNNHSRAQPTTAGTNQNNDNNSNRDERDPYYFLPQRSFASVEECESYVLDWNQTRSKNPSAPLIRNPYGSAILPCGRNGPMYPRFTGCSHGILFPLIIGPVAIFCTSTVPHAEWWSRAIAIILAIFDLLVLHVGSMVDPGVILPLRVGDEQPADGQLVEIDGVGQVKLEVCRTCKILRPPRSSHCGYSRYCVCRYDHACGVTSHIVTEKTFKWFVSFMYITSVLIIFVAARSIQAAVGWDTKEMTKTSLGTWYLVSTALNIAFIGIALCWVSGVGCHYSDLVCTGHTLKDRRGRRREFSDNQNDHWSCSRWINTMCCPYPRPSALTPDLTWSDESDNLSMHSRRDSRHRFV